MAYEARQTILSPSIQPIPKDLWVRIVWSRARVVCTGAQTQRRGPLWQAGRAVLDEVAICRRASDPLAGFYRTVITIESVDIRRIKANVRVIAATHQNLETRVKMACSREGLVSSS